MIIMYTTTWCGDCVRTKEYFKEKNVKYKQIDIEKDKQAMDFVMSTNQGKASVPTLVFEDGSTMTEPTNKELADKLGLD